MGLENRYTEISILKVNRDHEVPRGNTIQGHADILHLKMNLFNKLI